MASPHVSRASLPPAAQRWLARAWPVDRGAPPSVRLEQEGSLLVRDRWAPFHAVGVYQAPPLSFRWQAKLRIMSGVWILAEDGHAGGQGWGGARLWGRLPMGRRSDPQVLTSQVLRNLGELPWLPALALADPGLKWFAVNDSVFEVQANAGGRWVAARFTVDAQGDVVRSACAARPYDVPGGYEEAPWFCAFSAHRKFDAARIPAAAVATFEKSGGPWEYFRCRIVSVT